MLVLLRYLLMDYLARAGPVSSRLKGAFIDRWPEGWLHGRWRHRVLVRSELVQGDATR